MMNKIRNSIHFLLALALDGAFWVLATVHDLVVKVVVKGHSLAVKGVLYVGGKVDALVDKIRAE